MNILKSMTITTLALCMAVGLHGKKKNKCGDKCQAEKITAIYDARMNAIKEDITLTMSPDALKYPIDCVERRNCTLDITIQLFTQYTKGTTIENPVIATNLTTQTYRWDNPATPLKISGKALKIFIARNPTAGSTLPALSANTTQPIDAKSYTISWQGGFVFTPNR